MPNILAACRCDIPSIPLIPVSLTYKVAIIKLHILSFKSLLTLYRQSEVKIATPLLKIIQGIYLYFKQNELPTKKMM